MAQLTPEDASDLTFKARRDNRGEVVVTLGGELDITTVGRLESALNGLLEDGARRLVIDAYALRFADSSAIALLVRWAKRVDEIEIMRPSPLLRKLVESMGLTEILHLTP